MKHIREAVEVRGKLSGDGWFTKNCHSFFEKRLSVPKALLTTSCTSALEMAALLLNIAPGDEVILPSYTFVSTANAFALRGAKLVFVDSAATDPNVDPDEIARLISPKTKAIAVVHYAGVACDMDRIMAAATAAAIPVVEDAAQAIESYHDGKPLGTLGQFGAFSFHETKNVVCGEGGLLIVNRASDSHRAEVIREKGTNRAAFFRGEVDKYSWMDIGSSYLPSELNAAYLWGQLEQLDEIQKRRVAIWDRYFRNLSAVSSSRFALPHAIPDWASKNGHMFYLVCENLGTRTALIEHLKRRNVHAVSHYVSLHSSPHYAAFHDGRPLPNCDRYMDCLARLPMYYQLTDDEVDRVSEQVLAFEHI
jgi:dTDP-4-amino-4,6-dideoxygalactose transaminase